MAANHPIFNGLLKGCKHLIGIPALELDLVFNNKLIVKVLDFKSWGCRSLFFNMFALFVIEHVVDFFIVNLNAAAKGSE